MIVSTGEFNYTCNYNVSNDGIYYKFVILPKYLFAWFKSEPLIYLLNVRVYFINIYKFKTNMFKGRMGRYFK